MSVERYEDRACFQGVGRDPAYYQKAATWDETVRLSLAADSSLQGAILAIPSTDTIKVADDTGVITSTPERRSLWRAQTPQIFRWQVLMDAYEASDETLVKATDDAALVETLGGRVAVVEGSPQNLKVTDRFDLRLAEQILAERRR